MTFRNLKTGNILTVVNKDVIDMMTSSPNYEKITKRVATTPPAPPADTETGNKGNSEGGEKASGEGDKPPRK